MSDLTEFLLARIAEDEAVAREAATICSLEWEHVEVSQSWRIQSVGADPYGGHASVTNDTEGLSDSVDSYAGPHIARWDPARVLAECEAKRRVVAYWPDPFGGWTAAQANTARSQKEHTLRLLALPYADHPDYREEWRP